MVIKEPRDPEQRYPFTTRVKGKALDWVEATAARHGMDTAALARELYALGSQHWQRTHPEDINPAATRA